MKPTIRIKRVYEEKHRADGYRVLVDRLWPRGIRKEAAALDEWAKELAPSAQLRQWFGHDPGLWPEFRKRYRAELAQNEAVAAFTEHHRNKRTITLLYGAKDTEHNHAIVLQKYLEQQFEP